MCVSTPNFNHEVLQDSRHLQEYHLHNCTDVPTQSLIQPNLVRRSHFCKDFQNVGLQVFEVARSENAPIRFVIISPYFSFLCARTRCLGKSRKTKENTRQNNVNEWVASGFLQICRRILLIKVSRFSNILKSRSNACFKIGLEMSFQTCA